MAPNTEGSILAVLPLLAFFLFGVALVVPGASQPAVAAALGLGLVESGLLASALSLGLGLGVVLAGPAVDRLPRRPLFAGAALLAAGGIGLLPWLGSYAGVLAAVAVLGFGGGVFETVLNTVIPERDPARAVSRLSLAHAFATAGAALGAGMLGAGIAAIGWQRAWLVLGVGFVALSTVGAAVRMPAPDPEPMPAPSQGGLWPGALPLALASAAYVGLETALTVFLPAWVSSAGLSAARGPLAISAFWAGLLAARLVVAALPGRVGMRLLFVCAGLGAVLFGLAPVASGWPELWAAGVGLALGPVFPMLVAATGERFSHARGVAVGVVVGAGSLGGIGLPWAAGALGEATTVDWAIVSLGLASLGVMLGARRPSTRRSAA